MHSTHTAGYSPTCPLCGLGYANEPLLELHIREDHLPGRREDPDHADCANGQTSQPPAGGKSKHDLSSGPAHTTNEVIAMTAARRPHRPRARRAMTIPGRAIRALRYTHEELLRASEAMIRSARVPQPRRQPDVPQRAQARPVATRGMTTRTT